MCRYLRRRAGCLLLAFLPTAIAIAQPATRLPVAEAQPLGELPPLTFPVDALEPVIDAETMRLHHGVHHQRYMRNLSRALQDHPDLAGLRLDALLARAPSLPAGVRRNAGGHYNHTLFWQLLARPGRGGTPSQALRTALAQSFGDERTFFRRFATEASTVFGSGWIWLVRTPDGALAITTTLAQDNPLMPDVPITGTPLLALDLWEHAYYLTYRNRRDEYISAWWRVVNWHTVNARFAAATNADDTTPR